MRSLTGRRAALGLVLGTALSGTLGPTAQGGEGGDVIALSTDGTRWTTSLTEPLFDGLRVVPGDVETATVWLRNTQHSSSTFTVTVADPHRFGDPADPWFDDMTLIVRTPAGPPSDPLTFAALTNGAEIASGTLAPDGSTSLTLEVAFPVSGSSGNGTGPTASFDLVVAMAGTTVVIPTAPSPDSPRADVPTPSLPVGPRGPNLPWTGSNPLVLLLSAGGAIGAGVGLAVWSTRRRR